jgi:hypothetical protein
MKKLAYIKLNRQTPCPPRGAVPVNTRMWLVLAVFLFSFLPNLAQAFYNPQTGHWLSRDPIAEKGGVDLSVCSANNLINYIDSLGQNLGISGASPGYGSLPTPNFPNTPDPSLKESWNMLFHLYFGSLGNSYDLPDSVIEQAKNNVNKPDVIEAFKKQTRCGGSGQTTFEYHDESFFLSTGDANGRLENTGKWDLKISGTALWDCDKAAMNGSKCYCACKAKIYSHAVLTKVYTFRVGGYNDLNKQAAIQFMNGVAVATQFYTHGNYDINGPAYSVSANFNFNITEPFHSSAPAGQ